MRQTALLLCIALLIGCATPPAKPAAAAKSAPPQSADITNTDPCATRLHDISGLLLMYGATNQHLPSTLDDLRDTPGFSQIGEMVCPVSKKPYIYNPQGIPAPTGGRIVLYDPTPAHNHLRWAVTIVESAEGGALVSKVIAINDAQLKQAEMNQSSP